MVIRKIFHEGLKSRFFDSINRPFTFKATRRDASKHYEVAIHIGASKTGSSAIQYFLLNNTSSLSEYGFHYPKHTIDKNKVSSGHMKVGRHLILNDIEKAQHNFKLYLKKAKRREKCLLLSSESFFTYPSVLRKISKNHKVLIIAFFRDPIESLISRYNQGVKRHFWTDTLQMHCRKILNTDLTRLSGKSFDGWSDAFGIENLTVLPYHGFDSADGRLEWGFLSALGIDHKAIEKFRISSERINKRYSTMALELKRLLNLVLNGDETRLNRRIDLCLQNYSDSHPEPITKADELLGADTIKLLQEKFATTNEIIKTKYLKYCPKNFLNYDPHLIKSVNSKIIQKKASLEEVMIYAFKEDKDLIAHIRNLLILKLSEPTRNYSLLKLAELFRMELHALDKLSNTPFSKNQINLFINDKDQLPDVLRELALMLEDSGQVEDALRVIRRAVKLRPNGPVLKMIKDRLVN